MHVIKRNGRKEEVKLDKVTERVKNLSNHLSIEPVAVAQKVVSGIYPGITTREIDNLLAETAAVLTGEHPDYARLAGRIAISSLHKDTVDFYQTMKRLHKEGSLSDEFIALVKKHGKKLETKIDYDRDLNFDFFGYKTLEKSYLLKVSGKVVERPQHLYMRVALGVCGDDFDEVVELYDLLSQGFYTHATPTLFNAGTRMPQLSSCFLLAMEDDSVDGIYNTLKDCALISKSAGGIGLHIHNVRATGTPIKGTNGISNGIIPMLKVFHETARYIDQCFSPETTIPTTHGLKRMDDIVVGDTVFSHRGNPERVSKVFRKSNVESPLLYGVKLRHSYQPTWVTGAHPMLALQGQSKILNFDVIRNQLEKKIITPDYVPVSELKEGDMIGYSIPQFEQDLEEYTEEDCRFYGVMLGNGHVSQDGDQAYVCGKTSSDDFAFYRSYLEKAGCRVTEAHGDENCGRLVFTPQTAAMFKFGRVHLYKDGEKAMHPSFLHLPLNKALQIVRGVLETDGHIGVDRESAEIVLEMTSKSAVDSVRYILLRAGVLTSGAIVDGAEETHAEAECPVTTRKTAYRLRVPKLQVVCDLLGLKYCSGKTSQFRHENTIYSRIVEIETKPYLGAVYDLELDGPDHTYLTDMGVAHNGGGKRKGSISVYLEPWHADIESFLDLRKNNGKEELRARDLYLALWTPDLFMERVKADGNWTLMCPKECPGLSDVHGIDFDRLYTQYESEGRGRKTMKARELMAKVIESQIETGAPYMLFKDAANRKSNQKHLGTIKSSNLCVEIIQYSSPEETAVCNLASMALPMYVKTAKNGSKYFDDKLFQEHVQIAVKNLNRVIDRNYYPTPKTLKSNMRHRPVGLGVQGLADVFFMMGVAYDSEAAKILNRDIFESMYFAAIKASNEIAKREGSYESFEGSPTSQGLLQFDLWGVEPSQRYDWASLKESIKAHGMRNSLLVAPMPTASTAQIFGNVEAFEAQTSNMYKRSVLSGEFIVINKHLVRDLEKEGLWTHDIRDKIMIENGSVQNIPEIPTHLKEVYKTVWEISQKVIIDLAADRGPFICQSQSMNLFLAKPNFAQVNSALWHAYSRGLKSGMYYLRTKPAMDAQKVTTKIAQPNPVTPEEAQAIAKQNEADMVCSIDNPEDCQACGS